MKQPEWSRKQFLKQIGGAAVAATFSRLTLFGAGLTAAAEKTEITPLPFNGSTLKVAYDEASEKPRLLGIFSPTCANCLKVCSDGPWWLNYPDWIFWKHCGIRETEIR